MCKRSNTKREKDWTVCVYIAFKNEGIYYETDFKIFFRYKDFYLENSCFLLESKGIELNQ